MERTNGLGRHDAVVALTEKELRYTVFLDADGGLRTDTGTSVEAWSAEHFLLAALLRCTAESLRYSARKRNVDGVDVSGSAKGLIRRREEDGRYAVVRTDVGLDASFDPKPSRSDLVDILEWAERGCFIGSSLTAKPVYHWNVT
jgi:hypothetical protein